MLHVCYEAMAESAERLGERLRQNRRVSDKQPAHITWERVHAGTVEWHYPQRCADVLDVARSWASHLLRCEAEIGGALSQSIEFAMNG